MTRPGAFLGKITRKVRNLAADLYEPSGGRTLDVGCGNGLFFASLNKGTDRFVGSDLDLALLHEAGKVFRDNDVRGVWLTQANALDLPFPDDSFDNVFFLNTLINIALPETAFHILAELMRVCRPGGRVLFDIRNGRNLLLRLRYGFHNLFADFTTRGYDLRQIRGAFASSGFETVHAHTVSRRFPFGIFSYLIEAKKSQNPGQI